MKNTIKSLQELMNCSILNVEQKEILKEINFDLYDFEIIDYWTHMWISVINTNNDYHNWRNVDKRWHFNSFKSDYYFNQINKHD